jgi:hypothetical protein
MVRVLCFRLFIEGDLVIQQFWNEWFNGIARCTGKHSFLELIDTFLGSPWF